jgi:hypothetical protein
MVVGSCLSFFLGVLTPAAGPDWMWAGGRDDVIRGLFFRPNGTFPHFGRRIDLAGLPPAAAVESPLRADGAAREGIKMGKLIVAAAVAVGLSGSAWAQKKDCAELKTEIEAKIKKNGVEKFNLDVVDANAQADGKVVGTCEGGSKKIVYKKA